MKRLTLALCLVASPCWAQVWVQVGTSDVGAMYIDASSIRQQGAYVKAWSRFAFKEVQTTTGYPQFFYRARKALYYYDCKTETYAVKQSIFYEDEDGSSKLLQTYSYTDAQLIFEDPIPGTMGQTLLRRVCSQRR